jgi:hypothetical protein
MALQDFNMDLLAAKISDGNYLIFGMYVVFCTFPKITLRDIRVSPDQLICPIL